MAKRTTQQTLWIGWWLRLLILQIKAFDSSSKASKIYLPRDLCGTPRLGITGSDSETRRLNH